MAADTAGTLTADKAGVASTQRRRTLGELVSISLFWYALNLIWAALPIFLVPAQVVGLLYQAAPSGASAADWVKAREALTLATVLAPGLIVALIANPLFGLLSDRTPGRFGRRRPYILGGTLLNVVGLLIMAFGPTLFNANHNGLVLSPGVWVLIAGLMLTQLANNAAAAPFHALLPDMVPEDQRGLSSGIMGIAYWLGTISGSIFPFIFDLDFTSLLAGKQSFDTLQHGIVQAYFAIIVVIVVMAVLTAILVREPAATPEQISTTTDERHVVRDLLLTVVAVIVIAAAPLLLIGVLFHGTTNDGVVNGVTAIAAIVAGIGAAKAFGFRPRRNPDFSWVVLTRMLLMVGVYIVLSFLSYYMADVAHAPPTATGEFLIVMTITATLSTTVSGWASDRIGRKRLVYIAGTFMAVVGAAFVLAPYIVPGHVLPLALGAAAVFGLGFGAYISVDWALVADVLPSQATFARDMGVWNIGITIAGATGAIIGGWLLTIGRNLVNPTFGYTLLFAGFVFFAVLGTVTIRNIKGVKR